MSEYAGVYDSANCLQDVIDNAARVQRYLVGLDKMAFERNRLVIDAVERCFVRLCEAVVRLGTQTETLMPGNSWIGFQELGDRLQDSFDVIGLDAVWRTARVQLPALAAEAAEALSRLMNGNGSNEAGQTFGKRST